MSFFSLPFQYFLYNQTNQNPKLTSNNNQHTPTKIQKSTYTHQNWKPRNQHTPTHRSPPSSKSHHSLKPSLWNHNPQICHRSVYQSAINPGSTKPQTLQFYQATNPPAKPTQLPPKLTQPPSNPTQPTHQIQPTHGEPRSNPTDPRSPHPRQATPTHEIHTQTHWDSHPNSLPSHKQPPSNPTQPTHQTQSTHNEPSNPANPSNPIDPQRAKTTHGEPRPPHPRRPTSSHNHLTHGDPRLPMSKHQTTAICATAIWGREEKVWEKERNSKSLHADLCHLPNASRPICATPIWGREERVWEKERNSESERKRESEIKK